MSSFPYHGKSRLNSHTGRRTRRAHNAHTPRTFCAHAVHTPCARRAHAAHAPRTICAPAMHTRHTCHTHAAHTSRPPCAQHTTTHTTHAQHAHTKRAHTRTHTHKRTYASPGAPKIGRILETNPFGKRFSKSNFPGSAKKSLCRTLCRPYAAHIFFPRIGFRKDFSDSGRTPNYFIR